ncbi:hypothetical protein FOL47_009610 [Perkinsus chesapeaki]|uniref:Uncharacterized protein n=1 Tax=Perkinsus chesapeaki TaxID=330153 RepID=A0A7J6L789_PERCH|nr:hypothetical protein FOL47_009610 [Perkinsus chesapeaki]
MAPNHDPYSQLPIDLQEMLAFLAEMAWPSDEEPVALPTVAPATPGSTTFTLATTAVPTSTLPDPTTKATSSTGGWVSTVNSELPLVGYVDTTKADIRTASMMTTTAGPTLDNSDLWSELQEMLDSQDELWGFDVEPSTLPPTHTPTLPATLSPTPTVIGYQGWATTFSPEEVEMIQAIDQVNEKWSAGWIVGTIVGLSVILSVTVYCLCCYRRIRQMITTKIARSEPAEEKESKSETERPEGEPEVSHVEEP